jgi:valyl-tRNA synthetase
VVDPLEAIERHGADALRFGLAYQATDAQGIPYGEEHTDAGRRFANKIWNAVRFVLSAGDVDGPPELPPSARWTLADRWLLSRHQGCLTEVDRALDEYRIADALRSLHRFFWSELCDWGLETAKPRLYEGTEDDRRDAWAVLAWVLERSLRLLHPFMPFVTEESWQRFDAGESIVIAPWPGPMHRHLDPNTEAQFTFAMGLITAIRRFRKAHGIRDSMSMSARVYPRPVQRKVFESLRREIERLANLSTLELLDRPGDPAGCARLVADGAQVLIPLAGVLDREVERARLEKRLAQIEAQAVQVSTKLLNEGFAAKAPEEIVQKERTRLSALQEETAALATQLDELG